RVKGGCLAELLGQQLIKGGVCLSCQAAALIKGCSFRGLAAKQIRECFVWLPETRQKLGSVCLRSCRGSNPLGAFVLAAKQQLRDVWVSCWDSGTAAQQGCLFVQAAEQHKQQGCVFVKLPRRQHIIGGCLAELLEQQP
nr:hypothetical protein [Tanacetum cinerariifolium]